MVLRGIRKHGVPEVTDVSSKANPAVLPENTRIGRIALRVSDLEEMTDFYRDTIGLNVLRHFDTRSIIGVADTPLLVLEEDESALERHNSEAGLYHNAFRVPSREALGDALNRLRKHWHLDNAVDHKVSEALYSTDPEGNGIEIYRDTAREEWSIDDNGRVQFSSKPLDLNRIEAAAGGMSQAPPETDIGHIHLEVTSLNAFRDLYIDTIGFKAQNSRPNASFISAGGYHHHLGANTWNHRTEPVSGRGLLWFEILLPNSQTLDALRERLLDSQYTVVDTDEGISVTDANEITARFRAEA